MSKETLIVGRIGEGTVLDHLESGSALRVLKALGISPESGDIITIAMNVPSGKLGKKDILKVERRKLTPEETNRISLICPNATVNIIVDYSVKEKREVQLPDKFINVFRCPNPTCVSNTREPIVSTLNVLRRKPISLQCAYCRRVFDRSDFT
jgi:aspartate carbamoyltransferase regulatory subunit